MLATTRSRARRSFLLRRWSRRARGLLGGLLSVVSGLALWVALLGGILAVGVTVDKDSGLDPALRPEILAAWLWVAAVGVCARYAARTLRAIPRRMVLWLRRFRHTDSILAVSTALDHLGHSWRVVTLDDATAEPSGAAAGLRLTTSAASVVHRGVAAITRWISTWGVWVVRAYLAAWVALVAWTVAHGEPFAVLDALGGDWRQWPVPAVVAASRFLAGAAVVTFAGLLGFVAVYVVLLPLLPVVMMAGSVGEGVRRAELHKRQTVTTLAELTQVSATVAAGSGAAVAPRLTVLTVATPIWREAVLAMADRCHAVLLDVSTASEALLWEVRELGTGGPPVVFVGEEAAVTRLLAPTGAGLGAEDSALRRALDDCEVITYRTTAWGRVRFQRALYGALETTAPPRLTLAGARRWAVTCVAVVVVAVGSWQAITIAAAWPWSRLVD